MNRYFVAGTGTGVGKTFIASALACRLRTRGAQTLALKPIISGYDESRLAQSDTGLLLAAQGRALLPESVERISPWRFQAPLSPDMAAEDEGRTIPFGEVVRWCRDQEREGEYMLVEGVGGVMTPLTRQKTALDWAGALGYPVILVTGSYLGTLSHTLCAAHAVLHAGLTLHALVINDSGERPVELARMQASLRRFLPRETAFHCVGRLDSCPEVWKYAAGIIDDII